jgi:sugar phosphate isomerase/epimerase
MFLNKEISRRKMLLSSGTLLLGAGLLSGNKAFAAPDKKERKPFRISLNTATISGYRLPVEQQIDFCAEAGFDGIELWFSDVEAYVQKGGTHARLAAQLKSAHLILENMIGFAPWLDGRDGMDKMKREMDIAAALGSRCIAATASGVDKIDRDKFEIYSTLYAQTLEYGDNVGVRPLLEIWGSGALNKLSDAVHIALGAGHPNASLLLDFYHLYRGNNSFDSLRLINGATLPIFHINDYPKEPSRNQLNDADRVYPGDGICPFDKLLPLLYETGFRGALSLELFNPAYWTKTDAKEALKIGYEKVYKVINHFFTT